MLAFLVRRSIGAVLVCLAVTFIVFLIFIVVPGGKISRSELKKITRNPELLDEDEADYQYSMAALQESRRLVSAESVLRKHGRRVDR